VLALNVSRYGSLDSLTWNASPRQSALESNEVELRVEAAGVNFKVSFHYPLCHGSRLIFLKDLLMALGLVEATDSRPGLEAAGTLLRVGAEVKHLHIGDRIAVIGPGAFTTTMIAPAAQCIKIPKNLSLQDAATMPLVFSTVIYSLIDIGQLQKSQV
jgi:NADPH:quinone reductase-like Zn-dependent oxidoreductase